MVCVGIDVAKDKHDCCILDSDGTVRADCFTIPNNMDGFKKLLQTIQDCTRKTDKIKVGLEATGHYSYNILGFLLDNGLPIYVINPLHTNLYRKSLSLRKTKTDRLDARTIATMLRWLLSIYIPVRKTLKLLCSHGEAWFSLFAIS
jgi:transposase